MQSGSSISARVISDAVNQRAERAFGKSAKNAVAVANVEHHTADVDYAIRTSYSLEVISRPVRVNTTPLSLEGARAALQARQSALMSNPGQAFRQLVIDHLKANPLRIRKPAKFKIASDDHFYYSWQACHGCAGDGTIHCHSCHGRGAVSCGGCYGSGQEQCWQCNASGWVGGPRYCSYCGGSGVYLGKQCTGCAGRGGSGHQCYSCAASGKVACSRCRGTTTEQCSTCNRGWITCDTCDGACNLTYEWHYDIYAQTEITYHWPGAQPWMSEHLKAAVNDEANYPSVFQVSSLFTGDEDAFRLTGKGYVNGATATVTYKGRSAACQFLGETAVPVNLGGVLSGNFVHVLQQLANPKKLRAVHKASSHTIASALIKEVEQDSAEVKASTPVKSGVITLEQAEQFLELRKQARNHLFQSWNTFKWRAVLRLSWSIFVWLTLFYLGVNLLGKVQPGATQGVIALLRFPAEVFDKLLLPYRIALEYGGWTLWTFILASLFAGSRIVPRVWPKIDHWPDSLWLRAPVLLVTGSATLAVLLALAPTTTFYFFPPGWMPTGARISQAISGTFSMMPAMFITSLCVALVRYKLASKLWVHKHRLKMNF